MEMRVSFFKDGRRSMRRASSGSAGRLSSPSCVEFIVVPFGQPTAMGLSVGRMLMMTSELTLPVASTLPKVPVQPVSAIPMELKGGPGDVVAVALKVGLCDVVVVVSLVVVRSRGSPLTQA